MVYRLVGVKSAFFGGCAGVEKAGSGGVSGAMGPRITFSTSLEVFFCFSIFDKMIFLIDVKQPFSLFHFPHDLLLLV